MIRRSTENPIDKISVYVAAGLISGGGALMFNVMPAFVGAMAQTLAYDESELGDIVAAFQYWLYRSGDMRCVLDS